MARERLYKNSSKKVLAHAYGFQKEVTIVSRIKNLLPIKKLNTAQLKTLGKWEGGHSLLPDQVKIIVEHILGTPQHPEKLYTEKIVHHD